ncbi:unnamed protein product [Symbiodinium sp. CCMP2592]|nr:unnamed protein product [Symbiodinium sp. CCMP2592]
MEPFEMQVTELWSPVSAACPAGQANQRDASPEGQVPEIHGGSVMTFGKHRGRTFEDVRLTESAYCAWALAQPTPSGGLIHFVQFLRQSDAPRLPATPQKRKRAAKPEAAAAQAWPQVHAQLQQVAATPANPTFGRWGASGMQPPNSEVGCLQEVSDLNWRSLPQQTQRTCNLQANPGPISAATWHRPGQFIPGHHQEASRSSWIAHNAPGLPGHQGQLSNCSFPSHGGYTNTMESADPRRNPTPIRFLDGNFPVPAAPHGAQWQQHGQAHSFQPWRFHGTRAFASHPELLPTRRENLNTQSPPPPSFPSHALIPRAEKPSPRNPAPQSAAPSRKRSWTDVSFPRQPSTTKPSGGLDNFDDIRKWIIKKPFD